MIQPEIAIEALRIGELNNAWNAAEEGIRINQDRSSKEFWEYRFVRAEILRIRGRFEEALGFLEVTGAPPEQHAHLLATWKMHCGYCLGFLGRYIRSRQLLQEAESEINVLGGPDLRFEVLLRQAMISFLEGDYTHSDRIYRVALDECKRTGDYPPAITHYQRALKPANEIKDPVPIKKGSHNIEMAFAKLTEQAKQAARKASEATARHMP